MYQIVETDEQATTKNGSDFTPVLTLASEHGGRVQIAVDDSCYVLYVRHPDGHYGLSSHWFHEAVSAMRTLPNNPREAQDQMLAKRRRAKLRPVA